MFDVLSGRSLVLLFSCAVNVAVLFVFINMDYKDKSTLIACNIVGHDEFCKTARNLDQLAHTGFGLSPQKIITLTNP